MLTAAAQAYEVGFNVLRVNQRTCGASERLSATLYNSGLGGDYRAILEELISRDELPAIFFAGYSMGGNLVFKMAGELGAEAPRALLGVCGVCPTIDLARCVDAVDAPGINMIYRWNFVHSLKARMRRKARYFEQRYRLAGMDRVRTVREFDDLITAPHCGYRDAADYYERASAVRVAANIAVPALIVTAQDDPFVPAAIFDAAAVRGNHNIQVVAPRYGGHCGFISRHRGKERYWAEARLVEFCARRAASAGLAVRHWGDN
jgi:predicted alpha/beta-fold hydrolase